MKTQTVETPVQMIDGYVPLCAVDGGPNWVLSAASAQHGSHNTLPDDRCMVLVDSSMRGIPPGHWIITYSFNDYEGIHDLDLWVAARVR